MATPAQAIEYLKRFAETHPGMPVFVLIGQDMHAADLVDKWATFAGASGTPIAKVHEARQCADEMRAWPIKKFPD